MKKTLATLALALASASALAAGPFNLFDVAPTLSVEYNYNSVKNQPQHNQYGYVGLAQPTRLGVFDAGLQTVYTKTDGFGTDRARGWEIGYAYPLDLGFARLSPRIAYGAMNKIDPAGSGFQLNARYYLASVEATRPITDKVGAYVSFSHMNGTNADSVARANRVQVGADFTVTDKFSLRLGISTNKFGDDRQNGGVLIGSYAF